MGLPDGYHNNGFMATPASVHRKCGIYMKIIWCIFFIFLPKSFKPEIYPTQKNLDL